MRKILILMTVIGLCFVAMLGSNTQAKTKHHSTHLITVIQNANLDFKLVNSTGYAIKELYIGPSSNKNWTDDMEVLHGGTFANGGSLKITFNPKATAEKWDIMVAWDDGSPNDEWYGLKLTEIDKVTLTYDRSKNETYASYE